MKKLIFMAAIATITFTSCTKNAVVPDNSSIVATAAVESALRQQAPTATNVSYTEVSPTAVEASYTMKKTDFVTGISKDGKVLYNGDKLTAADLPGVALDYLTATYPGYELVNAVEKNDKNGVTLGFAAFIKHNGQKFHIHFDATGKFISSVERSGLHKCNGEKLTAAQLPAEITTYLTTNYAGYTFVDAVKISVDGTVKGYGVRITTADGTDAGLMFDGAGGFVIGREGDLGHGGKGLGPKNHDKPGMGGLGRGINGISIVKIETTELPAPVTSYITTNYAGATIKRASKISKDGVVTNYLVELTGTDKKIHLVFDVAGAFVKEGKR